MALAALLVASLSAAAWLELEDEDVVLGFFAEVSALDLPASSRERFADVALVDVLGSGCAAGWVAGGAAEACAVVACAVAACAVAACVAAACAEASCAAAACAAAAALARISAMAVTAGCISAKVLCSSIAMAEGRRTLAWL